MDFALCILKLELPIIKYPRWKKIIFFSSSESFFSWKKEDEIYFYRREKIKCRMIIGLLDRRLEPKYLPPPTEMKS